MYQRVKETILKFYQSNGLILNKPALAINSMNMNMGMGTMGMGMNSMGMGINPNMQ